ncbi:MAG: hypothetical protein WC119_08895 [Synergistaceae bacterium]|jgi:hypothetical protein
MKILPIITMLVLIGTVVAIQPVQLSGTSPDVAKAMARNNSLDWFIEANMSIGPMVSEIPETTAVGPWADDKDVFLWGTGSEGMGIPSEPLL